jgi:hypothetical protein
MPPPRYRVRSAQVATRGGRDGEEEVVAFCVDDGWEVGHYNDAADTVLKALEHFGPRVVLPSVEACASAGFAAVKSTYDNSGASLGTRDLGIVANAAKGIHALIASRLKVVRPPTREQVAGIIGAAWYPAGPGRASEMRYRVADALLRLWDEGQKGVE